MRLTTLHSTRNESVKVCEGKCSQLRHFALRGPDCGHIISRWMKKKLLFGKLDQTKGEKKCLLGILPTFDSMDFFLFDRPSRLPANACQSDTSLTAGGIFTLAYHPQGSGWRWDRCLKPSSVVWMFAGSGSSSSKMFSVIPSNQMSVLTLCPGWSPVLSWALRPVVDKSPTHISATLDRQDPNKLRQQQHMTL